MGILPLSRRLRGNRHKLNSERRLMGKFNIDPDLVERLAELVQKTDLSEIEISDGDSSIRVVRQVSAPAPAPMPQQVTVPVAAAPASAAAPAPAPQSVVEAPPPPPKDAVTSPMVGTVYLRPDPNSPPFISVGDRVSEGDTMLIIEAMKVMNQIRAPRSGTIRQILVDDKDPVEFGQPLLVLDD